MLDNFLVHEIGTSNTRTSQCSNDVIWKERCQNYVVIRHESACELSKQHECVMGEECSGGAGATREAKSTGMGRSRTHSWLSEMQLDSKPQIQIFILHFPLGHFVCSTSNLYDFVPRFQPLYMILTYTRPTILGLCDWSQCMGLHITCMQYIPS